MVMDGRHHHARRDLVLVAVPVSFDAGSPKEAHRQRPPRYPRNSREPWRPRTKPPSKAERLARFLDAINRQDQTVRDHMASAKARAA